MSIVQTRKIRLYMYQVHTSNAVARRISYCFCSRLRSHIGIAHFSKRTSACLGAIHFKKYNAILQRHIAQSKLPKSTGTFLGRYVAQFGLRDRITLLLGGNEWHLNTQMCDINIAFWNCGQNRGISKRPCVNRASESPVVSEVHPIGALKTCMGFVMN